jgi:hypothetical protein
VQNATILRLEVKEMAEYVLDPGHWPELPPRHRAFLERALPMLQADARLDGLAAGGSFITLVRKTDAERAARTFLTDRDGNGVS